MNQGRRSADKSGWRAVTCWIAQRLSEAWDWVDKRNIDLHAVLAVALWMTIRTVEWALDYATIYSEKPELAVGSTIAAVLTPVGLMQAALFKFYVDAITARRRLEKENP